MTNRSRKLAARLLFLASYLFAPPVWGEGLLSGRVVKVSDGDTIHVLLADMRTVRVRLAGIDAPERKQAFGEQARKSLADLVAGRTVEIRWHKEDRFGRLVGKVIVGNVDIGLMQVARGYAWHYKKYQVEQSLEDRAKYSSGEDSARQRHVGLWRDQTPVPPWEWRASGSKVGGGKL